MWLVICFDLPVGDKNERRDATRFRNRLLDEGFTMKQWSVYNRYFSTRAQADAAADRIGGHAPPIDANAARPTTLPCLSTHGPPQYIAPIFEQQR